MPCEIVPIQTIWAPALLNEPAGAMERNPTFHTKEHAMMTRLLVLGLCSLLLLAPVAGQAADYRFVDRGDTYYLDHLFENQLVVVLGKENGWVKVRYLNGAVDWVAPSRLLTQSQSNANDTAEKVVGTGVVLLALFCLANPAACSDAPPAR
jgi:hypothetical protein